jgi:hypothetical protein
MSVYALIAGCSHPAQVIPASTKAVAPGPQSAPTPAAIANPLLGAWVAAEPGESSVNGPKITLDFDDHGGLIETMSAGGESVVLKSKYTTHGNNLTERFVSLTGLDAQVPAADRVKTFQFKVTGDTLSLTRTPANNVMVFTRVIEPDKIH